MLGGGVASCWPLGFLWSSCGSRYSRSRGVDAVEAQGSFRKRRASSGEGRASKQTSFAARSCMAAWASSGKAFSLAAASLGSDEKSVGTGPEFKEV